MKPSIHGLYWETGTLSQSTSAIGMKDTDMSMLVLSCVWTLFSHLSYHHYRDNLWSTLCSLAKNTLKWLLLATDSSGENVCLQVIVLSSLHIEITVSMQYDYGMTSIKKIWDMILIRQCRQLPAGTARYTVSACSQHRAVSDVLSGYMLQRASC